MKGTLFRIAGGLLIVAAVIGLVISLTGLVWIWRMEKPALTMLTDTADLLDQTFQSTTQLLEISNSTLILVKDTLEITQTSLEDVAVAMGTTKKITTTTAKFLGDDLAGVIGETEAALKSVQKSAGLIDDTLRVVTRLPLVGARYAPDKPLQESIGEVADSLKSMPNSLEEIQSNLNATSKDLTTIQKNLDELAVSLTETETQITEAGAVLTGYRNVLNASQNSVSLFRENLARSVRTLAVAGTVLLVWLLISQIGLAIQGFDLISRKLE
ncbi:MAG: hypothetical protein IT308_08835 [Anaerolineaceae bacterium]|nr:hypothetical protein [Anaerolineaceae bacterium]